MKKDKKLHYLYFIAPILMICAIIFAVFYGGKDVAAGAYYNVYNNYIEGYDAVFDIHADRSVSVAEEITFHFYGMSGFVREIPVNGGEKIKNIGVKEIANGTEKDVYYDVYSDEDEEGNPFVCVDMGSRLTKYENHTYRLTYDYTVPETKDEGKSLLALAPVGSGYGFIVEDINLKFLLPSGFAYGNETVCFINSDYNKTSVELTESVENGQTVLSAHVDGLPMYTGVRFDLQLSEGEFESHFDFTPYIFVIVAVALLAVLIIVKMLCFGNKDLTPVVNFEAPNNMDPLLMGKLIDTKVNNEDITSMIFYFADKGYLKINLDDEKDPTLIRIVQNLPASSPDYEKTLFNGLFAYGETVKPSQLANRFYKTAERVTASVNSKARGFFTGGSIFTAVLFALLGALLLGVAPFVLALTQISTKYFVLAPFVAVIPAFVIFGASQTLKSYGLKLDKKKKTLFSVLIAIGCAIFCLIYALFVPKWIMGFAPKLLLCAVCCAVCALSVTVVSRSDAYTQQLNEIVGFKNFILLAEKDKLEKMLEDDPQFYYHVLPYAQVLGVSDKWEEKFEGITVQPPQWASSSALDTVFRFHVFNTLMRNSMANMTRNMVSRPSSGASGGGHFGGGSFGGFSGGGHGGGGGHFR